MSVRRKTPRTPSPRVPLAVSQRGVVEKPEDVTVHRQHAGTFIYLDVDTPHVRLALPPEVARVLLMRLDEALG